MNKQTIITILFALVAMAGQAQTIKASYEDILDSLPTVMQEYMAMQGVQHLCVTLRSVFNGKRAKMKKVSCDNGMFTEHNLLPDVMHLVFTDSIERLDFMALPLGSDSLRIACFYPDGSNRRLFEDTVKIDRMKILLETLTPGNGPDYHMIAYSAGIPVNGGTWYCGLHIIIGGYNIKKVLDDAKIKVSTHGICWQCYPFSFWIIGNCWLNSILLVPYS